MYTHVRKAEGCKPTMLCQHMPDDLLKSQANVMVAQSRYTSAERLDIISCACRTVLDSMAQHIHTGKQTEVQVSWSKPTWQFCTMRLLIAFT